MSTPQMSPLAGYEPKDASVRVVLITAGVLIGGLFASIAAAAWVYTVFYTDASSAGLRQTSFTHGPEERIGILEDVAAVEKESRDRLENYGWADQKAGVVHVPIEQAMDQIAAEASKPKPAANR